MGDEMYYRYQEALIADAAATIAVLLRRRQAPHPLPRHRSPTAPVPGRPSWPIPRERGAEHPRMKGTRRRVPKSTGFPLTEGKSRCI